MIEEQRRILNMVADGRLNAAEAESLLDAISDMSKAPRASNPAGSAASDAAPKYLRVLVDSSEGERPGKVNVRVPFELIRAGMRLAALLPTAAHGPVNRALKENGVDVDLSKLKPEDLEDLVTHLRELHVDVVDGAERVRVFCE